MLSRVLICVGGPLGVCSFTEIGVVLDAYSSLSQGNGRQHITWHGMQFFILLLLVLLLYSCQIDICEGFTILVEAAGCIDCWTMLVAQCKQKIGHRNRSIPLHAYQGYQFAIMTHAQILMFISCSFPVEVDMCGAECVSKLHIFKDNLTCVWFLLICVLVSLLWSHMQPITTYHVTLFGIDCALLLFLTLFICVERRCIDYHTMACDWMHQTHALTPAGEYVSSVYSFFRHF